MKRKLLILLCACMFLGGCGRNPVSGGVEEIMGKSEQEQQDVNSVQPGRDYEEVIALVELKGEYERAAFLTDMVYDCTRESTLVSPLSLELALGLAAEGCSGETAEELYEYLGRDDYADWAQEYMEYTEQLTQGDGGDFLASEYSFRYTLANSIWVNEERKLLAEYQKNMKDQFRAEVQSVDFVKHPDKTAKRINSWCDEKTNGLIPKMIEPNMLGADLSAILMNSVYFESSWIDKWGTGEHEFRDINGKVTTREMLVDTLDCYYENDYATAFSKDYYNGFRFIGILPKSEGNFEISDLDLESLMDSKTTQYDVKALVPKLNFETTAANIIAILQAQGVEKVFDKTASRMDRMIEIVPGEVTYISEILQKCKIELDEEGTRAAAATAIFVKTESCAMEEPREVKEVYLDRPFAFMIYDSTKKKIVFMGKVTEL